jgi:hypothetical protein
VPTVLGLELGLYLWALAAAAGFAALVVGVTGQQPGAALQVTTARGHELLERGTATDVAHLPSFDLTTRWDARMVVAVPGVVSRESMVALPLDQLQDVAPTPRAT